MKDINMTNNDTPILLIWELLPDDVEVYVLHLTPEGRERVLRTNGTYINTESETDDTNWLNRLLEEHEPISGTEVPEGSFTVVRAGFVC